MEAPEGAQPLGAVAPADVDHHALMKRLIEEQVKSRVAQALAAMEDNLAADAAVKRLTGAHHISGVSALQVKAFRKVIRDAVVNGLVTICSHDHADKVTGPEGNAGLERIIKMGTQRAANPDHALNSLLHKPQLMQRLASKVWANRWKETRRRVRDAQLRPAVNAKRIARSINSLRKRRASHSWTLALKKLKAKNHEELQDEYTYNLAKESCRAVYLPDFDREKNAEGKDAGPFVLRLQPWLTEAALGFQELARNSRPTFADTVLYDISDLPGSSKPPKDIPAWMLADDGGGDDEDEDEAAGNNGKQEAAPQAADAGLLSEEDD